MPRAPKHCGQRGCTTLVRGRTFCDQHNSRWPDIASPRTGLDDHREARDRVLDRDHHRCRIRYKGVCIGTATIRDHIVALELGGTDTDDNSQAACEPCHRLKSADEGHLAQGHSVAVREQM